MVKKINFCILVFLCGTQLFSYGGSLSVLPPPKPDNKLITNEEINHHLLNENDGIRENEDFLPIIPYNNTQSNDIITTNTENNCPNDSQLINGQCECLPCHPQTCDTPNTTLIEIEPSLGKPGQCCPVYKCITPCKSSDGRLIDHNTWWVENCQNCTCYNGLGLECFGLSNCNNKSQVTIMDENINTSKTCITNTGDLKLNGAKWSPDYCTLCTCDNGDVKCIAHYCEGNSFVKKIPPTDDFNNQQNYICEPLFDCNLQCGYGYRILNNCEICECGLNPQIIDLAKQKNISIDDVYMLIHLNNADNLPKSSSSTRWTIYLSVAIIVLIIICCGLFWCKCNMRLQNTKMDVVCKTHELKKLVNGQAYDTGLNATYKYTTTEYPK